jgi:hypothetical protein
MEKPVFKQPGASKNYAAPPYWNATDARTNVEREGATEGSTEGSSCVGAGRRPPRQLAWTDWLGLPWAFSIRWTRLPKQGAGSRSLADAWADTTTPHGKLMLTILERDEIRLRPFFSCPAGGAARVLRAGVHSTLHGVVFAIFCPGPAVHRRRDAMPGPGHEIVSASRLPDESIQLQHIML